MFASTKIEHKIVTLSVIAALSIWGIDAMIDAFIFKQGSLLDELFFDVSPHEIYFRALFIVSFILFGLVSSRIVAKRSGTARRAPHAGWRGTLPGSAPSAGIPRSG